MSNSRGIPGARTAQRALRLLKLLATHHAQGMTAREIAQALSEERSAVQRALASLIAEGLVQRASDRQRYQLGVEAMHIGLATLAQSPLLERYRFDLQKIARATGDTVFLSVRIGDYVLCVHRDEGTSAVRVARTRAGDIRVLGTTAGGLALLSRLQEGEVRRIYDRHQAAFDAARMDWADLRRLMAQARRQGFAVLSDNVSEGVTSLGVCLQLDDADEPFAAAAIAAARPRMGAARMAELYRVLQGLNAEATVTSGNRRG